MLWFKAFHIIAMVCWFAALFYLPRLFVYHRMSTDAISIERFKVMERKLYRGIMMPSMLLTLVLGFVLVSYNTAYYEASLWFQVKLGLVACLVVYHFVCGRMIKTLAKDECERSHVYYRWFNEFPVLILLGVVILVVVRPF